LVELAAFIRKVELQAELLDVMDSEELYWCKHSCTRTIDLLYRDNNTKFFHRLTMGDKGK